MLMLIGGVKYFFFFSRRNSPQWVRGSSLSRLHDHIQTYHNW